MNNTLEEKVNAYYEAKVLADKAKETADNLGKELKELLEKEGIAKEVTSNGLEVSMIAKTTIKYNDELAIKAYLKSHGLNEYIVETIDTKKFNDAIKNNKSLNKSLNKDIVITTTYSLSVKEKK